jgi:plastocyanin
MPRLSLTALACVALAFGGAFVAGCGSDDKKDSGSSAPAATAPAQTTSGDTGGTSPTNAAAVAMQSSKFVPETISVAVGQKIKWTNKDGYAHNVTSTAGEKINSGNIDGGATFEFAPKKAGTIAYTCTIHPNQNGKITVTK